jgi:PhnB protein
MAVSESPVGTSIAPWMAVRDGAEAVEYYQHALGAVEAYRLEDDDGGVAVARLQIGDATFWVQEDASAGVEPAGARPIRIILTVDDPDAFFERAVAAGAKQVAPVHQAHGWRTGRVTDPFGHDWELSKPVA